MSDLYSFGSTGSSGLQARNDTAYGAIGATDTDYGSIGGGVVYGNSAQPSGSYGLTFATDVVESARFDAFTPRAGANDNRPWYERVAEYGLGRYIDNQWGPTAANNTSQPGTFAGQNGRTYTNVPVQSQSVQAGGGFAPLLIVAAVAAALLLMK